MLVRRCLLSLKMGQLLPPRLSPGQELLPQVDLSAYSFSAARSVSLGMVSAQFECLIPQLLSHNIPLFDLTSQLFRSLVVVSL